MRGGSVYASISKARFSDYVVFISTFSDGVIERKQN